MSKPTTTKGHTMNKYTARRILLAAVLTAGIAIGANWMQANNDAQGALAACPTEDSFTAEGCIWDDGTGRAFVATGTSEADLVVTYLP